jgi:hypothetical protein
MKKFSMAVAMLGIAGSLFFSSCGNNNPDDKGTVDSVKQPADATKAEKHGEQNVLDAYLDLKEALVKGDAEKAKKDAGDVKQKLAEVKMDKMAPDQVKAWNDSAKKMTIQLDKIESAAKIDEQRDAFSKLSDAMYGSVQKFGLASETVYHTFCPMAFDGKGAFWLSDNAEIRNPYYGEKSDMLGCGEVKDTIRYK